MKTTTVKNNIAKFMNVALAVILVVGLAPTAILSNPETAQAASKNKMYYIKGVHGVGDTAVNNGTGYITAADQIAYCADIDKHGPSPDEFTYYDGLHISKEGGKNAKLMKFDYVYSNGYPNTKTIGGVTWTKGEARDITQLAIWIAAHGQDYVEKDLISWKEGRIPQKYMNAASSLANDAATYAANGGIRETATLPNVIGMDAETAQSTLENAGFVVVKNYTEQGVAPGPDPVDPSVPEENLHTNLVTSASTGSTVIYRGDVVTITIDGIGTNDPAASAKPTYKQVYVGAIAYITNSDGETQPMVTENAFGYITVTKASGNPAISNGNECYSLSGAVFTIKDKNGKEVGEIVTDASGSGTSTWLAAPATYTVEETTPPKGYALNGNTWKVKVNANDTKNVSVSDLPQNDPAGLLLAKYDGEKTWNGDNNLPQGSASLKGAEYVVKYYDGYYNTAKDAAASGSPTRTWVYATDENGVISLQYDKPLASTSDKKIRSDAVYQDSKKNNTFPLGTYVIQEYKAPEGYLLNNEIWVSKVTSKGTQEPVYTYNAPNGDTALKETVKRGDVSFVKKSENNNQNMAGIPFRITLLDQHGNEVENHIVVTDENGKVDTSASWNKHTYKTNQNDQGASEIIDGIVDGDNLLNGYNLDSGVWFGANTIAFDEEKGTYTYGDDIAANDERGALPYGMYKLEELPCPQNEGMTLVSTTFKISYDYSTNENRAIVDLGTFDDRMISIGTTATDKMDGDSTITAEPGVTIADKVHAENLEKGTEYVISGVLMDKATGKEYLDADGNTVTGTAIFTATAESMDVYVDFTFNASNVTEDTQLVVFERLATTADKDRVLAFHEDISDQGQTVKAVPPHISTTAKDAVDGDKDVVADETTKIYDEVAYDNLTPGKEYVVTGTLMVKETGKALLDADGKEITGSTTFTPEKTNGTVTVTFEFDSSLLAGKTLVAFEQLDRLGITVATHTDIEDEDQSVTVVPTNLHTTAADTADGDKRVVVDPESNVTDVVEYENVVPGKELTIVGILMDKATGLPMLSGEGMNDVDPKELSQFCTELKEAMGITKNVTLYEILNTEAGEEYYFFPEGYEGHSFFKINEDGSAYVVVDEAGKAIEGDTTSVPVKDFEAFLGKVADVYDTPMTPDYEAISAIMKKHADLLNVISIQKTTFTPEKANGTVTMEFPVNSIYNEAMETVVFEFLFKNGTLVSQHADLDDEGQTVAFVNSTIGTTATDKTDGDHELLPSREATIVDHVEYTDLIPGKEYNISGVLMDKATGKKLVVGDSYVTAEKTFVPNTANGSVDLEFTFDATALKGKNVVVFESLYKDGILIAEHADINDEGQTVHIAKEGLPGKDTDGGIGLDQTGQNILIVLGVLALIAAIAAGIGYYGHRQRKLADSTGDTADTE